jgi:hypothetical protein
VPTATPERQCHDSFCVRGAHPAKENHRDATGYEYHDGEFPVSDVLPATWPVRRGVIE